MSDQPTEPTVPFEHSGDVETVGPEPARPRSRGVRIAGVAVAVAGVLGGGAYAAYSFLDGGGPQPADVLPASTIAVVSVDLDPSAGQKIAAIKSIRRFPALKDALGLHADDDLREFVFDKAIDEDDCPDIDFEEDVKPWLGKRAAFAGVDLGDDTPAPVIALQVSDAGEAKKGFDAIVECADPEDFAFVVDDDYLIASDTAEHAQAILAKGKEKPLADDAAYQKWTGEAGDSGVINFYVGKRAAGYAADFLDGFAGGFTEAAIDDDFSTSDDGDFSDSFSEENRDDAPPAVPGDPLGAARDLVEDFQGLGGTVRFADGGMELSIAGGGIGQFKNLASIGEHLGDLPADTAAVIGFGVSDDYAEEFVDQFESRFDDGSGGFLTQTEEETGLDLPEDLQTLLGKSVTLSLGGDVPSSLESVEAPGDVPAGLVIHGDADKIKAVIAKVEDHLDMNLSDIPIIVDSSGDKVVLATSRDYAGALLEDGSLGSADRFREAVPDAGKATSAFYVDFDSAWRGVFADIVGEEEGSGTGQDVEENTKPLRALGISSWMDGDVSHALLKVTTD